MRDNPLIMIYQDGQSSEVFHIYTEDWTMCGINIQHFLKRKDEEWPLCRHCLNAVDDKIKQLYDLSEEWSDYFIRLSTMPSTTNTRRNQ